MLSLNHLKRTERAVAHLWPKRLVYVTWAPHSVRAGTCSVLFLYEHLGGGWVMGEVGCDTSTNEPDVEQIALQTSVGRDESQATDVGPLLARLDQQVAECVAKGDIERFLLLQSLPVEIEARLAGAMQRTTSAQYGLWAPDAPSVESLTEAMLSATREFVFDGLSDRAQWAPGAFDLIPWLENLSAASGAPLWPQRIEQVMDARCWAYLLAEASASQQDGVGDVLRVLDRHGAEAFCDLLPDPALGFLAARIDQARKGFERPRMPRYTVADYVHGSMALFSDILLKQWTVEPMQPAVAGSV